MDICRFDILSAKGLHIYRPRNGHKASLFTRVVNWAILKLCLFLRLPTPSFWKVFFGRNINRLFYSCGLLIAFFQILWAIIGWTTFLVSSFSCHWNFTNRFTSDVIMAQIIGRGNPIAAHSSWPLPPDLSSFFMHFLFYSFYTSRSQFRPFPVNIKIL